MLQMCVLVKGIRGSIGAIVGMIPRDGRQHADDRNEEAYYFTSR